jgi:hypothetical protein
MWSFPKDRSRNYDSHEEYVLVKKYLRKSNCEKEKKSPYAFAVEHSGQEHSTYIGHP